MLRVLCLCKICDSVWDACLEAAGIELCHCKGFIELDREGNTRIGNGQLLSLNVVKQRHVIVRNTGENHVERIQGNGLTEFALYYRPREREIQVVPERDGNSNSWLRSIWQAL
jgi:hypothetical protein